MWSVSIFEVVVTIVGVELIKIIIFKLLKI